MAKAIETLTAGEAATIRTALGNGSTSDFMRADGSLATPPTGGGTLSDADVRNMVGQSYGDVTVSTVTNGDITPDTTTTSTTVFAYGTPDAAQYDGYLTQCEVRLSAAGTGKFIALDADDKAVWDSGVQSLTPSGSPGIATFAPTAPPFVRAGTRLFYLIVTGGVRYTASAPVTYITAASYSGVGTTPTVTRNTSNGIAIRMTVQRQAASAQVQLDTLKSKADATDRAPLLASRKATAMAGASYSAVTVFKDAGAQIPEGSMIEAVEADLTPGATVTRIRATIYERALTSGTLNSSPPQTGDTIIGYVEDTIANWGLTASTPGHARLSLNKPLPVRKGYTYGVKLQGLTVSSTFGTLDVGQVATTFTAQRNIGWVNSNVAASADLAIGFGVQAPRLTTYDDRIVGCTRTTNGLSVTHEIQFSRNGYVTRYTDTRTLTAPTSGKARYDDLLFDVESLTFSLNAGTEDGTRADASERIATAPTQTQLRVARLRVKAGHVYPVDQWDVYDGIPRALQDQIELDEMRNRKCLQRVLRKLYTSGATLKIASMGDSIVAIANDAVLTTVPNGNNRDRAAAAGTDVYHYLRDSLSDDLVDDTTRFPLYTSTALGRAADTAGTTHTRFGFVWSLISELEAQGKTLGTDLFYDNWGNAGSTSTGSITGIASDGTGTAVQTAYLTAVRDGTATGAAGKPDLVIVNYGMNADASIAITRRNIYEIGIYLKAAGIDVIFMGRVVKRALDWNVWDQTNRAIRQGAEAAGCAFIPMQPLYNERYNGALGVQSADYSAANAVNHPGPNEHAAIGKLLARVLR